MSDAPRDVRARLGEWARHIEYRMDGMKTLGHWDFVPDGCRDVYIKNGEMFATLAASCGLKIVPDGGETK